MSCRPGNAAQTLPQNSDEGCLQLKILSTILGWVSLHPLTTTTHPGNDVGNDVRAQRVVENSRSSSFARGHSSYLNGGPRFQRWPLRKQLRAARLVGVGPSAPSTPVVVSRAMPVRPAAHSGPGTLPVAIGCGRVAGCGTSHVTRARVTAGCDKTGLLALLARRRRLLSVIPGG